ncbi:zinc metalloproteinase nas-14 [Culex quinquefasciatus]|uniref:zinc metalloproteinase nas-14 n=1 Tax=Culex quinquefasciatus TaxID=7176 RepID=UPI0018E2D738|nr:zinc metalloproteinase nas-14 [Culex quinquefasciatus]
MSRTLIFYWTLALAFGLSAGYHEPREEVGEILKNEYSKFDRRKPFEMGLGYYYQGDILLKPKTSKVGLLDPATRWPNGIVPYKYEGSFSFLEKSVINAAILQYSVRTCVRFVPYKDQPFYITITKNDTGCYSYVGYHGDNQYHRVNLQSPYCLDRIGTPVHEFLHVLGAFHEFTRPDRDDWISINKSALREEFQTEEFFNANFALLPVEFVSTYNITYNYQSVMHYSKYAGAASPNYPVMINKKPFFGDFGNDAGMSQTDVDMVNIMYCGKKAKVVEIDGNSVE